MIILKKDDEIAKMRQAAAIAAAVLVEAGQLVKPGVRTIDIDDRIEVAIRQRSAVPSFKEYRGYKHSSCISINEQIVHGLPSERTLVEGDIVGIDVGACYAGYHGDVAATFAVGRIDAGPRKLMAATVSALYKGIDKARHGSHLGAIGAALEEEASKNGYRVVRELFGHGIGRTLHEDPLIPNFGEPLQGPVLRAGMTLAIEPMLNEGGWRIKTLADGWTVVTLDGRLSAHFEHTVLVKEEGAPEILTRNLLF